MIKKIIQLTLILVVITLACGCSVKGFRYYYVANDVKDWQIESSKTDTRHHASYVFKCGEVTYWVHPSSHHDSTWIGFLFFPYVIPAYLFDDGPSGKEFRLVEITISAKKENVTQLQTFTPLLRLQSGDILRPSACKMEGVTRFVDYRCVYDIEFKNLPSFSLFVDTSAHNCSPLPLDFVIEIIPEYIPLM